MKKYYMISLIFSLFAFSMNVYATEETCDFKTQARLINQAAKVVAKSEIVEENGKTVFKITVYNITDELYVVVRPEGPGLGIKQSFMIYPSMTKDQSYTFTNDDLDMIVKYRFTVRSNVKNCVDDISTFYFTKPKRNSHYNKSYCKYKEVADYYYCREWIDQNFELSDPEIQERIERKRDSLTTTTTAYCPSCRLEEEQQAREKKIFEIKKYIIAGLIVGILIDLTVIVVLLRDLKKRGL